jgi:hypothetical protein
MENAEAKPKYIPLIQKPMCCNVTCTQMILQRHGITPPLQDEIAKHVGVTISKNDQKCFMRKLKVLKKPYGIETVTKKTENMYNKFFKAKRLPFRVKAFRLSKIKNYKRFIIENLKKGNDIQVEVSMKKINGKPTCHDLILSKISCNKKCYVILIDPWWMNKQFHRIKLETLIESMNKKWFNRELGFLIYYKK